MMGWTTARERRYYLASCVGRGVLPITLRDTLLPGAIGVSRHRTMEKNNRCALGASRGHQTREAAAVGKGMSRLYSGQARGATHARGARLVRPTHPVLRFVTHNAALIVGHNSGIATWMTRFGEQTRALRPRLHTRGLCLRRKS